MIDADQLWQPSAPLENLRIRAEILKKIRDFFSFHQMTEVETPLAARAAVTDPHLCAMETCFLPYGQTENGTLLYLQTSPEYAMKRLLCAGMGSIYQICKAFRNGETGRWHNPEFTMLEWYEVDQDHHGLMDRVDELLNLVLAAPKAERFTYQAIFESYCDIDPLTATLEELRACAQRFNILLPHGITDPDRDLWLQLMMNDIIEPKLGMNGRAAFVYDFPASQAMLSRVTLTTPPVAERFEVYLQGIELANGFHELASSEEQHQRFKADLEKRETSGLPTMPIDYYLLAALKAGLPDCAGIALGIDRLVMMAAGAQQLSKVLSFALERI